MSHTATGEWKSFEIRMRRRRAERLVLRADVAADAGCLEDARASLEEARTLWPTAPGMAEVQQKIDNGSVVIAVTASAPSKWKEVTAAAAAVLFISLAIGVVAASTIHHRLPARDAKAIVDAMPVADQGPGTGEREPETADRGPGTAEEKPAAASVETPTPEPVRDPQPPTFTPPPSLAAFRAPVSDLGSPVPGPRSPVPEPRPAIPDLPSSVAGPVPGSRSPAPDPPQEALVRSALARYAKAYDDLDVEAAEHVWPSVNRSALERAFESLQSQRVSLGDCRITVDGNSAHASCAGTASWTPKVGGRARTDERSWDFELEKSAAGWQITGARVQNR